MNYRKKVNYYQINNDFSAAWITRNDGIPVQYMHYLPYGQLLANQMLGGYNERFKFIGKERDFEKTMQQTAIKISPFAH